MNRQQLGAVLWLRWRLTRNQWRRGGNVGAAIALVVAVAALVVGAASFVAGLAAAALGLGNADARVILTIWFVLTASFLFFWTIGLISELQRAETLDLPRLLHLPVALGQIFTINYLVSHAALSLVVFLPAMTGLAIGLAIARGPAMALLLPLAWSMVFMITAWTYCLRGWLATMMSNPRRRRTIVMGLTAALILISQLPNFYFNILNRESRAERRERREAAAKETPQARAAREAEEQASLDRLIAAQRFVPPLWLPYGAYGLAQGRVLPAAFGFLGCAAIGAIGLRRAYRSTVRFYQGETGGRAAARRADAAAPPRAGPRTATAGLLDRRLPALPEPAAAVALGTWQSMRRAPEVKMALGMTFVMTVVFGSWAVLAGPATVSDAAKPFVATGAMAFSLFMLSQFLANQFGFDRDGFRTFVLAPVDRRWILLGKNLASAVVGGVFSLLTLAAVAIWLALPLHHVAAALLQLATVLALGTLGGNLLSILMPFRIEPGSMRPTKMPALAKVLLVLGQLGLPLIMLPAFLPPALEFVWRRLGWPSIVPVNLALSVLVAALAGLVYWRALDPLARLLQRREGAILQAVTVEQE